MSFDDKVSDILIKKPTVSALSLAFSAASLGSGLIGADGVFLTTALASPLVLASASGIGVLNLFRNKSGLSKAFSAVSIGTGAVMAAAMMQDSAGWNWLGPVMACVPATVLASSANLLSHATRDKGLQVTQVNKDIDPSPKG